MSDILTYLLDNIFIRFGTKLYRQLVGIPLGTNCARLIADLFLFCYERDFMASMSCNKEADIIQAFNSKSRYLDDLLNIDNPYFEAWLVEFNHLNYSKIKLVHLILKPHFFRFTFISFKTEWSNKF